MAHLVSQCVGKHDTNYSGRIEAVQGVSVMCSVLFVHCPLSGANVGVCGWRVSTVDKSASVV